MNFMSSIIFKNEKVTKSEWYEWFLNKWKEAGWTNISSNPSTDGDVMYSEGVNGDKTLYIGFSGSITDPNSTGISLKIRHSRTYTPNEIYGNDGTFELTSGRNWWTEVVLHYNKGISSKDHIFSMWYYVTKNWGMFITDQNLVHGGRPSCFFVGQPEIELGPGDRTALIVAASTASTSSDTIDNDVIYYTGNPFNTPIKNLKLNMYTGWADHSNSYLNYRGANQNTAFGSTIVYGDSTGYKFQLDDSILITQKGAIKSTMNYNVNGQIYKFFNMYSSSSYDNSFYSSNIGIRIK